MVSKVRSTTLFGIDALWVDVEAEIIQGKRRLTIVGLPDGIVRESKDRVRCAIESSGYRLPDNEVVVSLAPASLPKAGSGFDLAIALSILAASGYVDRIKLTTVVAVGELALDGKLKNTAGILATACALANCKNFKLLVPSINIGEATIVPSAPAFPITSLRQAVAFLNGEIQMEPTPPASVSASAGASTAPSLSEVVGQHLVKRALEIAAAGGHNLLMIGPPGCGKSMLAHRLPNLLPQLNYEEAIEVTKISRAAATTDMKGANELLWRRPFRSPHHTTSQVGLIGGGPIPRPGEISLAHRGVLFLDELPEFRRDVLESLRQPLEDKKVTISRASARLTFPADFQLVAAMNPCPCGKKGSGDCGCSKIAIERYRSRISGPLLDRIDLQIWVQPVSVREISEHQITGDGEDICSRVEAARRRQRDRATAKGVNAQLTEKELKIYCPVNRSISTIIEAASKQHRLSARGFNRILKVARTIADLRGAEKLEASDVSEAISYRLGSL